MEYFHVRRCTLVAALLFTCHPCCVSQARDAHQPNLAFDGTTIHDASLGEAADFQALQTGISERRQPYISISQAKEPNSPLADPPVALAAPPELIDDELVSDDATAGNIDSPIRSNQPPIERYGEAPVDRSREFLRTVSPLLRPGQWQRDCGLVYALQEFDFPAVIGSSPARADVRSRALFVPLAVRYGWDSRTQLFANLPVGWADTEISTPVFDDSSSKGGLGDLTFGITRLLHQNRCNGRSLIGTLRAVAPTGAETNPLILTGAGLGNGVWRLGGDLLVVRSIDPVILFYGAGYTYSFQRDFDDVQIELGHEFQYNLGLGFAANERITLSTAFLGSFITETRFDDQLVPGSDQEPLRIRLAATMTQNCRIVEPFVNFGLTETAPAAELGIVWTR